MIVFHRQNFTELWVTLQSNEVLGMLDSDYVEDYYGTDGQVTLYDTARDVRTPIPMTEVTGSEDPTPTIPHDVFTGYIDLTTLSDGAYRIEGRVRDVVGYYTILSEVENPIGDERVLLFELQVSSNRIVVNFPTTVSIMLGVTFSTPINGGSFDAPLVKQAAFDTKISTGGVFPVSVVEYETIETVITKGVPLSAPIDRAFTFEALMDNDAAI